MTQFWIKRVYKTNRLAYFRFTRSLKTGLTVSGLCGCLYTYRGFDLKFCFEAVLG